MLLRNKIIGTASALVLAACVAGPASAMDNFNGLLGVDYAHLSANHGGGDANDYGVSGTGMFGVVSNFAAQIDGGYHHADGAGSTNDWNIGGTALWTGAMDRVGATIAYDSLDGGGTDAHVTNYGGFIDFYANKWLTASIKGGGFNGSAHTTGGYAGAALTGYVTPDFSLKGGYDYTNLDGFGNENDWSARAEYLISEETPIALYASYTNSKISSGGPTISVFSIGLTYFCDPTGPESLEAHDRTGAERWGNSFGPTLLKF